MFSRTIEKPRTKNFQNFCSSPFRYNTYFGLLQITPQTLFLKLSTAQRQQANYWIINLLKCQYLPPPGLTLVFASIRSLSFLPWRFSRKLKASTDRFKDPDPPVDILCQLLPVLGQTPDCCQHSVANAKYWSLRLLCSVSSRSNKVSGIILLIFTLWLHHFTTLRCCWNCCD